MQFQKNNNQILTRQILYMKDLLFFLLGIMLNIIILLDFPTGQSDSTATKIRFYLIYKLRSK